MFSNLTVTCTECTKRSSLEQYLKNAFDRIENFWSGNEKRPVVNRKIIPTILQDSYNAYDNNFAPGVSFFASMQFRLSDGMATLTFYHYPQSQDSQGNCFPDFSLPTDVFYGKFVLWLYKIGLMIAK